MGTFYNLTQILQGNALFTGKIYTAGKFFTRPPVATVATNFKSAMAQEGGDTVFLVFGYLVHPSVDGDLQFL